MRKFLFILGIITSGVGFGWVVVGSLAAADFFGRSTHTHHRLVATLMCEDPVTTFLSVVSLHGRKPNRVTIRWTDEDGRQTMLTEVVQPHIPLGLSCETVPPEFSQMVPIVVHLDSQHPTTGVVTHVLRGSPIQSVNTTVISSFIINN